jgi:hypothetical protein
LRTFLADPNPSHRAMAIDVLGYRGMATIDELVKASTDEPAEAAAALPHLAIAGHPSLRDAIDAALAADDPDLRAAAWLAMAYAGHEKAAIAIGDAIAGEQADDAVMALALVGDAGDAQRLLDLALASPTPWNVNAVGWAGAASAIVPLMTLLDHEEPRLKLAAAYALERITGAGLFETAEIEPEEILVAEVSDPVVGEPKPPPLAKLVSDPRDMPAKGAADVVQQPTVSAARWKAWWVANGEKYAMGSRYRRGQAYSPLVSLRELDTFLCTPGERRHLMRELRVRTGEHVRMDTHDFVVVQETALAEWLPIAQRASGSPGTWTRRLRRS